MSDKATHRTKAGVEVAMEDRHDGYLYAKIVCDKPTPTGAMFNQSEFNALFEPIPPPKMVTIPLHDAKLLIGENDAQYVHFNLDGKRCIEYEATRAAIAAAERGEA